VELHHGLNATERKAVTIDHLLMAATADVHHVLGVIHEERSRVSGCAVAILACESAIDVTRKLLSAP